jgi:Glycosyl hydrolase 36 superfamily, catalytic domain/Glycosyltransferase family 36
MRVLRGLRWSLTVAMSLVACAPAAAASAPPELSRDHARVDVNSGFGSGSFGRWTTGDSGLPAYRYTLDELTAPQAAQPELAGRRDAWHQLGNDHIVADAFNTGYVQLWSQDRWYEWMNAYDAASLHFAGGYGYLRLNGRTFSTLYPDRAPGVHMTRTFGVGYFGRRTTVPGATVAERVYAPMGDDAALLHDVTITNTSNALERLSWFEYWDVNPRTPTGTTHPAEPARYDAATRTLTVAQTAIPEDQRPLSVFAAALRGPVGGFDADTNAFFGSGGRAAPAAVTAGRLSGALAPAATGATPGRAMAAFEAPLSLRPGRSITLRYAYGYGHPQQIAPLVTRWRRAADPFSDTERRWASFVPQVSFGPRFRWLSRELQWDAYMVRSGATYEECAGHHVISQAGYYQYALDFQGAFRDPLQHALPMIYADPALARDVILYSAREQPSSMTQVPYGLRQNCRVVPFGTSDDFDLWLLWTAAEYGLATRDTSLWDRSVPWAGGGHGTLWQHLEHAFAHQESQRTSDGLYRAGTIGDWSDLLVPFEHMTESTLVAAQAAYVYPRLATLADLRGDREFARKLRTTAAGLRRVVAAQWSARGWYARGNAGSKPLGVGTIYEEPQPWAILAGIPPATKARALVANIRRYLTGVGAPGGPSRIGSAQAPAANDPGATEKSSAVAGVGDGHAAFPGGSWYSLDGWLAWALGTLDHQVPHAVSYAFSEMARNTLAAHAAAFPNSWDGVISVDDACYGWYATHPDRCGVGLTTAYDTQIMHQPAWGLYDAIMLAGVTPTADGYTVDPHLPMRQFSLRFPDVGVARDAGGLRGYVHVARSGVLRMRVAATAGARRLVAFADGRRVASAVRHGMVVFTLAVRAGRPADWAVVAG